MHDSLKSSGTKPIPPLEVEGAKEKMHTDASETIQPDAVSLHRGTAVEAPPPPTPDTRSFKQRVAHVWHGLPTAAKWTLILAVASTVLLIAYSITAVSLAKYDEQAHVSTVIIVMSVFILYAVFDAVIYENTLQIFISILLSKFWNITEELDWFFYILKRHFCNVPCLYIQPK